MGKTLAKQFQDEFRKQVAPHNFGLCDSSGTDALAHMVRMATDLDEDTVVTCVDGVGAFDHILRSSIFNALCARPAPNCDIFYHTFVSGMPKLPNSYGLTSIARRISSPRGKEANKATH